MTRAELHAEIKDLKEIIKKKDEEIADLRGDLGEAMKKMGDLLDRLHQMTWIDSVGGTMRMPQRMSVGGPMVDTSPFFLPNE